jgi:hypothetical protein
MRGVVSGGDGNHSASLPSGRRVPRRTAGHDHRRHPADPHLRHRARRSAGRPARHPVRFQLAVRHAEDHHQQARCRRIRGRLRARSQYHRIRRQRLRARRLRQLPISTTMPPSAWWAGIKDNAGFIDNVFGTRTFPSPGSPIDNAELVEDNYNTSSDAGARLRPLKVDLNEDWSITADHHAPEHRSPTAASPTTRRSAIWKSSATTRKATRTSGPRRR